MPLYQFEQVCQDCHLGHDNPPWNDDLTHYVCPRCGGRMKPREVTA